MQQKKSTNLPWFEKKKNLVYEAGKNKDQKNIKLKNFKAETFLSEKSELQNTLVDLANSSLLHPSLNIENVILSQELIDFSKKKESNNFHNSNQSNDELKQKFNYAVQHISDFIEEKEYSSHSNSSNSSNLEEINQQEEQIIFYENINNHQEPNIEEEKQETPTPASVPTKPEETPAPERIKAIDLEETIHTKTYYKNPILDESNEYNKSDDSDKFNEVQNTDDTSDTAKETPYSFFNRNKNLFNIDPSEIASITPKLVCKKEYKIPINLLEKGEEVYTFTDTEETKKIISILEETLGQFNVEGKVVGIQRGPIITRFELKIAPGIKVNKILSLTDELAMALEALRVRIEAPIPGRSTIGIEIPNKVRAKVLLGGILSTVNYQDFEAKLRLPIGKDIAGNLVVTDLTRLPHILIAGATGAGKSVLVNSFIVNFILNHSPENIRFLMIDPKLVELSQYNDIPHLLHPVITDPQKSIAALNWAVEEMERRYEDLSEARVRDITTYNEKVREARKRKKQESDMLSCMPYIIVLVDELGDLMMVAGKEVEASIIRLSQKARAVGLHLILATQRPSVDVITALIKANCPARIALQVAQKTDSRTILDANGAEQLLGQGDSLFKHPAQGQLIRVQAPLVKDIEVEAVVETAKQYAKPSYILLEDPKGKSSKLDTEEESLFEEAWQIILQSQKASASYLQRRLRIGYNKAARLIEAFESRGYIGPQIGSKPREILLTN